MRDRKCRVFLLSGFLGRGKTTLLGHLLKNPPKGETLAVLMNEFGRIGVDGDVVRKSGLQVVEVNRGSIFCACAKGDFLRALRTIHREYRPTILLIEASGVADTRDMKRDLDLPHLGRFFELQGNLCVVDGEHFLDWADLFQAVSRQVEAASLIVLNKVDRTPPEDLPGLLAHLRERNPDAPILQTSFGRVPWDSLLLGEPTGTGADPLPSDEEWEAFIDQRLRDETGHLAPPDAFYPQSILWEGDARAFREILTALPEDLVRGKGYFRTPEGWTLFDLVRGNPPSYAPFPQEKEDGAPNLAVFIRREDRPQEIPRLLAKAGLRLKGIRN